MTIAELTIEQYKTIEALAVDYLNQVGLARRRGRSHPEELAREPKIEAYRLLQGYGFDALEAVDAFAEIAAAERGHRVNDHPGIRADQARRAANVSVVETSSLLMLCTHCDGTGNELYAMYRMCPQCGGVGVVDREPPAMRT